MKRGVREPERLEEALAREIGQGCARGELDGEARKRRADVAVLDALAGALRREVLRAEVHAVGFQVALEEPAEICWSRVVAERLTVELVREARVLAELVAEEVRALVGVGV